MSHIIRFSPNSAEPERFFAPKVLSDDFSPDTSKKHIIALMGRDQLTLNVLTRAMSNVSKALGLNPQQMQDNNIELLSVAYTRDEEWEQDYAAILDNPGDGSEKLKANIDAVMSDSQHTLDNPLTHISERAREVCDTILWPLLGGTKNGEAYIIEDSKDDIVKRCANITIFAHSYGTNFARQVTNQMQIALEQAEKNAEETKEIIGALNALCIGDITNHTKIQNAPQFSGIIHTNQQDQALHGRKSDATSHLKEYAGENPRPVIQYPETANVAYTYGTPVKSQEAGGKKRDGGLGHAPIYYLLPEGKRGPKQSAMARISQDYFYQSVLGERPTNVKEWIQNNHASQRRVEPGSLETFSWAEHVANVENAIRRGEDLEIGA